jgi:23S rRNA (guanosine2251-2'-O)-methyltransferase
MENKNLIYGRNPALEYIKSSENSNGMELFISDSAHGSAIDLLKKEANKKNIRIRIVKKDFFSDIDHLSNQGVALKYRNERKSSDPDLLLNRTFDEKSCLVLLDQITDPQNTGSIIRTAEALGCSGIVTLKDNSSSINPTVIKASAGATAHIEILTVTNASAFIQKAKDHGLWVIGSSDKGSHELSGLNKFRPALIVIGSEGTGMRKLTGERCDITVRIPLKGEVSSLNASVAAGIIIYEIMKD